MWVQSESARLRLCATEFGRHDDAALGFWRLGAPEAHGSVIWDHHGGWRRPLRPHPREPSARVPRGRAFAMSRPTPTPDDRSSSPEDRPDRRPHESSAAEEFAIPAPRATLLRPAASLARTRRSPLIGVSASALSAAYLRRRLGCLGRGGRVRPSPLFAQSCFMA